MQLNVHVFATESNACRRRILEIQSYVRQHHPKLVEALIAANDELKNRELQALPETQRMRVQLLLRELDDTRFRMEKFESQIRDAQRAHVARIMSAHKHMQMKSLIIGVFIGFALMTPPLELLRSFFAFATSLLIWLWHHMIVIV